NAYLVEEASSFCAHYFKSHVSTRHRKVPRNSDHCGVGANDHPGMLSIFKHVGRSFGRKKFRRLDDKEYHAARTYILLNCDEVKPYLTIYEDTLREAQPYIQDSEIDNKLETEFASLFEKYASNNRFTNTPGTPSTPGAADVSIGSTRGSCTSGRAIISVGW
ncbi:hypothetical protein A4A49_61018, partial [Nicotiana attenuata]